jgi:hypothetical protein
MMCKANVSVFSESHTTYKCKVIGMQNFLMLNLVVSIATGRL